MLFRWIAPIVALFVLSAPLPVAAQEAAPAANESQLGERPPLIPTAAFAGRSAFWDARLSPDGSKLSFVRKVEGKTVIMVAEIETNRVIKQAIIPDKTELAWYRWAGADKLLISLSAEGTFFGDEVAYTRLMLLFTGEQAPETLFRNIRAVVGDDVIFVAKDGSYALVSIQASIYDYPSVYRHELVPDGKAVQVQKPIQGVWSWYADDAGVVRMGTGWRAKQLRIYYRPDVGSKFSLIGKFKEGEDDRYWDVAQIVSGSDTGYVLDEGENGRVGLRRFDYAKRQVLDTVYEHPEWDIDEVSLKDGQPFAAFYTDDRDKVVWFDKQNDRLYRQLREALGQEDVWVISRSDNDERMLVWSGGEADPGVLSLYTSATSRLDMLAEYRPKVDFRSLAKPAPVSFTARDGTNIRAYLTLPRGRDPKNLPLIILPHGGPYGVRDKLEYNDEVQLLANRGYAVLQPNFRGSGGYGDAFYELGTGQIGRAMQDDLDDAMDWAVSRGIADPARVCVVGGSYGGYAALWAVIRNPERYRCAASWAGVTDWDLMLKYDRRFFSREGGKKWRARVEGAEAFDLDLVSPYRLAGTLARPLLLAHGTADINVPFSQFRKFEAAAKGASAALTTLEIQGEGHSFSKPENEQQWYDALVGFLARHNPAD